MFTDDSTQSATNVVQTQFGSTNSSVSTDQSGSVTTADPASSANPVNPASPASSANPVNPAAQLLQQLQANKQLAGARTVQLADSPKDEKQLDGVPQDLVLPNESPSDDRPRDNGSKANPALPKLPADSDLFSDDSNGKSPLDILEEILQETDQEDAEIAKENEEKAKEEAEKAAQKAEYEAAMAKQKAEDEMRLSQQLQDLKTIESTPENQARVQQIQEEQQRKEQEMADLQGYQIRQISHTKVSVDELGEQE